MLRLISGKKFVTLTDKNFPKENELHKICKRNTMKISYSYMDNMETIIKAHYKIINKDLNRTQETCNCSRKEDCPRPGKSTVQNITYEATVTTTNEGKKLHWTDCHIFQNKNHDSQS